MALLHLAALTSRSDDVVGRRVWAVNSRYNFAEVVEILRRLHPERTWPDWPTDPGRSAVQIDRSKAERLLAELGSRLHTLEETLSATFPVADR